MGENWTEGEPVPSKLTIEMHMPWNDENLYETNIVDSNPVLCMARGGGRILLVLASERIIVLWGWESCVKILSMWQRNGMSLFCIYFNFQSADSCINVTWVHWWPFIVEMVILFCPSPFCPTWVFSTPKSWWGGDEFRLFRPILPHPALISVKL